MGVQGSGKGTQAKIIAKERGLCHISTGDLLRETVGELKARVDEIINAGNMVSDELMFDILNKRMESGDCNLGIILDGFPRNLKQAKILDSEIKINQVIEIKISDEESLRRLSGRVCCEECGAGYNLHTAPKPKDPEKCNRCEGKLIQRVDDSEKAIKKRIKIYHENIEPILEFYGNKVISINGEREIEDGSSILVIGRAITGPKTSEERVKAGYEVLQDMAKHL